MSKITQDPASADARRITDLERRLERLERSSAQTLSFADSAGVVRVRVGLMPDGKWGVRVYAADGVTLLLDNTYT